MLWTKATWSQYKLRFPKLAFGIEPARKVPSPADNSTAAEGPQQAAQTAVPKRIPADISSEQLEAQLDKYEAVSLGGAVAGSGAGAPHEGLQLPDMWAVHVHSLWDDIPHDVVQIY